MSTMSLYQPKRQNDVGRRRRSGYPSHGFLGIITSNKFSGHVTGRKSESLRSGTGYDGIC